MRYLHTSLTVLTAFLAVSGTTAQDLTPAQQTEISQRAYSLYYSPIANGLVSMNCDIKLDWSTIPAGMLSPAEHAGRDYLHETRFHITVDAIGNQTIAREYPRGTPSTSKDAYDKFFDWTSKTIGGFFMSWKSKSMRSPIPTGTAISHFASTPDGGYQITTKDGGNTVVLSLSKDLIITRMLSIGVGQSIDERTTYTQTPQGLTLSAVDATNTAAEGTTHIAYDLIYQPVNTILFPDKVHLAVDNLINMRFSFQNCSARKSGAALVTPTLDNKSAE